MSTWAPDLDAVVAAAGLVGRAGATEFEIAWDCPHAPDAGDGHYCSETTWTCSARWKGRRVFTPPRQWPGQAANALALQLLDGALCRCGQPVGLFGGPGCRWVREGTEWKPGCDAPPFSMAGIERGDLVGMNRAARRRMKRRRR